MQRRAGSRRLQVRDDFSANASGCRASSLSRLTSKCLPARTASNPVLLQRAARPRSTFCRSAAPIATTTWTGSKPPSTRNSAATTSTMDGPRISTACGSSTGWSSGPGRNGLAGGRGEGPSRGKSTRRSCTATRYCDPGSHALGPRRRVLPEEPTGVIPQGGVCEGRGSAEHHGEPTRARSWKRRTQTRNA